MWPSNRILSTLASLEDPLQPPRRICEQASVSYLALKTSLCELIDLPGAGGSPDGPCGSLSSAVGFIAGETRPASRVFRRNEADAACAGFVDECAK